jgi:hypothetical protein
MRINSSMSGIVLPGIIAGVIYFVIAIATGASVGPSVVGGVVIAIIALAIGFIFRAVYLRRVGLRHR